MTLMFLISIKHLPELDWASSSTLLASVAIIGIVMVLFIGGGGVAPALIAIGLDNKDFVPGATTRNMLWCSAPTLLTLVILLLHSFELLPGRLQAIDPKLVIQAALVLMAASACAIAWSTEKSSRASPAIGSPIWMRRIELSVGYFFVNLVWAAMATTVFTTLILMRVSDAPDETQRFFQALVAWLTILVIINVVVVKKNTLLAAAQGVVGGMFTMLLALVILGNLTGLAVTAFRALGLADIPTRLVVTSQGCELLNSAVRGGPVCTQRADKKISVVCPATLKSRLGSSYLIELAPMNTEGRWPSVDGRQVIPIPRDDVLSWPRIETKQLQQIPAGDAQEPRSMVLTSLKPNSKLEQLWLNKHCDEKDFAVREPKHS